MGGRNSSAAKEKKQQSKPKSHVERSQEPTPEEYAEISAETRFTEAELRAIWPRYRRVSDSQTQDGKIDIHEFQAALGLRSEGFASRVFAAFDSDASFQIDFCEFVRGIYAMSGRATLEDKARFCFSVYDADGDGAIGRSELSQIVRFSLGENSAIKLPEVQIEAIIDRAYNRIDKDSDGGITFQEFFAEATRNPQILACLNIDVDALLQT
jgi:serine/threonine-protein phosphatase 2B regulatory subunit